MSHIWARCVDRLLLSFYLRTLIVYTLLLITSSLFDLISTYSNATLVDVYKRTRTLQLDVTSKRMNAAGKCSVQFGNPFNAKLESHIQSALFPAASAMVARQVFLASHFYGSLAGEINQPLIRTKVCRCA